MQSSQYRGVSSQIAPNWPLTAEDWLLTAGY